MVYENIDGYNKIEDETLSLYKYRNFSFDIKA